jgi:hypothetical protein
VGAIRARPAERALAGDGDEGHHQQDRERNGEARHDAQYRQPPLLRKPEQRHFIRIARIGLTARR